MRHTMMGLMLHHFANLLTDRMSHAGVFPHVPLGHSCHSYLGGGKDRRGDNRKQAGVRQNTAQCSHLRGWLPLNCLNVVFLYQFIYTIIHSVQHSSVQSSTVHNPLYFAHLNWGGHLLMAWAVAIPQGQETLDGKTKYIRLFWKVSFQSAFLDN